MSDTHNSRYEVATRVLAIYQMLLVAGVRGMTTRAIQTELLDAGLAVGIRTLQRDLGAMMRLDLNIERTEDVPDLVHGKQFIYYVDRTVHSPFLSVVKNAA